MGTAAVGAGIGVVSTIAGMGEASRQRKIQRQQAQVQQYAQEVQYEQEKMSIKQQKEYASQTRQLEDMQLKAQDLQMKNALNEQALTARQEEDALSYQVGLKQLQDQSVLDSANSALQLAGYQQNEQRRSRDAQADTRKSEQAQQVSQQGSEVSKYLQDGDMANAAAMMMNVSQGQGDSLTSELQTNRSDDVANTLRALMEQGGLTEQAIQQALYEKDVAKTLQEAGLLDVALEGIGAKSQYDVNNTMTRTQGELLTTGKRKNRIGEELASKTLTGGIGVRDRQRDIDKTFGDMGFSAQGDNAGVRNASLMASLQAQEQGAKGSLFTTLANVASLGGSIYNAYEMTKPVKSYSSPVRSTTTNRYGPAF